VRACVRACVRVCVCVSPRAALLWKVRVVGLRCFVHSAEVHAVHTSSCCRCLGTCCIICCSSAQCCAAIICGRCGWILTRLVGHAHISCRRTICSISLCQSPQSCRLHGRCCSSGTRRWIGSTGRQQLEQQRQQHAQQQQLQIVQHRASWQEYAYATPHAYRCSVADKQQLLRAATALAV
jgi:hypothetical protein